ncbi:hypothetical protein VTL71DRAFT_2691 [Oculimacula yallundae]|uniref:Uncharacterized protein n=1 Tax=Oculimacula yallundae TaxID=86028 RepID=A0ABR4C9N2_9HELO
MPLEPFLPESLDRPLILNKTCLSTLASSYTDRNLTRLTNITNLIPSMVQQCTYTQTSQPSPPSPSYPWYLTPLSIFLILLTILFLTALSSISMHKRTIAYLRSVPSQQLHHAIEEEYFRFCLTSTAQREEFTSRGERFVDVRYSEDRRAKRRTVIVTEDMGFDRELLSQRPGIARGWSEVCQVMDRRHQWRYRSACYPSREARFVFRDPNLEAGVAGVGERAGESSVGRDRYMREEGIEMTSRGVRGRAELLAPGIASSRGLRELLLPGRLRRERSNGDAPPPPYEEHQ